MGTLGAKDNKFSAQLELFSGSWVNQINMN